MGKLKTVSKYNMTGYRAEGSVRGSCRHAHRTIAGAVACMMQDRRDCNSLGGGCYSDREVIKASGEWTQEELDELNDIEDRC